MQPEVRVDGQGGGPLPQLLSHGQRQARLRVGQPAGFEAGIRHRSLRLDAAHRSHLEDVGPGAGREVRETGARTHLWPWWRGFSRGKMIASLSASPRSPKP
jgi:hypothetical protein